MRACSWQGLPPNLAQEERLAPFAAEISEQEEENLDRNDKITPSAASDRSPSLVRMKPTGCEQVEAGGN